MIGPLRAIVFQSHIGDSTVVSQQLKQHSIDIQTVKRYELSQHAISLYKANFSTTTQPDCIDITTLLSQQLDTLNSNIWLLTPPLYATIHQNDPTHTVPTAAQSVQHVISLLPNLKHKPTYILIQYDADTDCSTIPAQLQRCQYNVQQHTLCSTQYGYPNTRDHQYILAVQSPYKFPSVTLPTHSITTPHTIGDYIDTEIQQNERLAKINAYLQRKHHDHKFDIVNNTSNRSHTFTQYYGMLTANAGSILSEHHSWTSLVTGPTVRFFTANEVQRLLGHKQLLTFDNMEMSEIDKLALICTGSNIDILTDALQHLLHATANDTLHVNGNVSPATKSVDVQPFALDLPFTHQQLIDLTQLNNINTTLSVDDTNRLFSSIDPYTIQQQIQQLQAMLRSEGTDEQWIQCIQCNQYILVQAIIACYCNLPFEDDTTRNAILELLWLFVTIQEVAVSNLLTTNTHLMHSVISQIHTDSPDIDNFSRLRLLYFILNGTTVSVCKINETTLLDCMSQLLALLKHTNTYISCAAAYCLLQLNGIHPTNNNAAPLLIYLYTVRVEASGWSTLSQEIVELFNTGCIHISQLQSANDTRTLNKKMIHYASICEQQMFQYACTHDELPCMYTTDLFVLVDVMLTHINDQTEVRQPMFMDYVQTLQVLIQWSQFKQRTQLYTDVRTALTQLQENTADVKLRQLCSKSLLQMQ